MWGSLFVRGDRVAEMNPKPQEILECRQLRNEMRHTVDWRLVGTLLKISGILLAAFVIIGFVLKARGW